MSRVSKSEVSRLCGELDERVGAFLKRPIEGDWPYLWIDATYVKTREAGRIVSVAVTVAVAVNTDGQRQVLGMKVGPSEAEPFWTEFLRSLMRRDLRGVRLVISDSHEGIKTAVAKVPRPPGGAAACTSCATRWRTRPRRSGAWSAPRSPPSSPRKRPSAYSTPSRTPFRCDGGQRSTLIADTGGCSE